MGLKESKKWEIGSLHENGGGKFEITKRWYEESTDTIMLEYKFLEDGRVETNKESNVNASEWKWKKVRGLVGKHQEEHEEGSACITQTGLEEYFEGMYVRLEKIINENRQATIENRKLTEEHDAHINNMLKDMMSIIQIQQSQIATLIKDNNIITKLLEKI